MSTQILTTKLYIPTSRPSIVSRPRLVKQFYEGIHGKLSLISAPAGFGKTTIVSEWVADCAKPVAWLSLDENDNAPIRFLTYVVSALQTVAPQIGAGVMNLLESPQPPPINALLTTLLNEIATLPHDFVLILDDYHILDSQEIDSALAFLIENQPPQMHLVITTREDPHLPLARLRARRQLTELRAADLRFTSDETAELLNVAMGLSLSPEDVAALEQRTEGWIAGLQLAAISMQGKDDKEQFLEAFTGSHRYIMDYLLEEVLSQQVAEVRQFLLQTSILDRLNADLCDTVTGQTDSQALLEQVERRNLFVIALDHSRNWFRYHHLFADVLQARLKRESPEVFVAVHQRASQWYEENEYMADAIRHSLQSGDHALPARLLEIVWPEMKVSDQSSTWFKWARQLPQETILGRPVLCLAYGFALINEGKPTECERYLQKAEKLLTDDQNTLFVYYDEQQFNNLSANIASTRAYMSIATGQVDQTIHYAKESLALPTDPKQNTHQQSTTLLGFASWAKGDLLSADRALEDYLLGLRYLANTIITYLGDLRIQLGRLHDAHRIYQDALAMLNDDVQPLGAEELYRGLAELHLVWGNLDDARKYLDISKSLGEHRAIRTWRHWYYVTEAQYHVMLGEYDKVLEQLDLAKIHYQQSIKPDFKPISAQKARIWIMQDRLNEAEHWANQQDLGLTDHFHYLQEYEHITLARLYMARYRHTKHSDDHTHASVLLAQLLTEAETGSRLQSVIEIQLLQAELAAVSGDLEAALRVLGQALDFAEPEGFVALFIMECDELKPLLQRSKHPYAKRLLTMFPDASTKTVSHSQAGLIEALSERELEILQLVAEGFSNREIGERLFLALDTIKGHNRRIFGKLGVSRRTEAIARAQELGLL